MKWTPVRAGVAGAAAGGVCASAATAQVSKRATDRSAFFTRPPWMCEQEGKCRKARPARRRAANLARGSRVLESAAGGRRMRDITRHFIRAAALGLAILTCPAAANAAGLGALPAYYAGNLLCADCMGMRLQ